jgi:hypothetical protein
MRIVMTGFIGGPHVIRSLYIVACESGQTIGKIVLEHF